MDLVTLAIPSLFGTLFAGGLVGFVVGRFTRFELGLGVGLLIPGIVTAGFAWQCLTEYQAFINTGPNSTLGEVTAIEDRPVNEKGSITQPVPVVRFIAADKSSHTVRGPAASGLKVGQRVSVIYEPSAPERARIGDPSQLRGGAIAMMLFGTFLLSLGMWFVHAFVSGSKEVPEASVSPLRERWLRRTLISLNLLAFASIVWIGISPSKLERAFVEGFGAVAAVMVGYAVWGLFSPRANSSWCLGMLVLAVNFGAWALTMHLASW